MFSKEKKERRQVYHKHLRRSAFEMFKLRYFMKLLEERIKSEQRRQRPPEDRT